MAIALRSSTSVAYGTRTNLAVSAPAGAVSGSDVIVVALDVGGPSAVTVTPPAGWTTIGPAHYSAPDPWNVNLYLLIKVYDGASSWTFTHASGSSQVWCGAYSGVDTSTPQDATASTNVASGLQGLTAVLLSITTATAGAMLIGTRGSWDGVAITPPAGWTERHDQPVLWVGESVAPSPGATGNISVSAGNNGASSPWGTVLAALRPITGGGSNNATLAASLPRLRAALAGTQTNPATLTKPLPRTTASLAGSSVNPAALAASLPLATASISEQATITGDLAARLPIATASITGTQANAGTMNAGLPRLTTMAAGTQRNTGALDAAVPLLLAAITEAGSANTATLDATLPGPTTTITGQLVNVGTMAATLPRATSSIAGTVSNPATMAARAPLLRTVITAEQVNTAALGAILPLLRLAVTDHIPVVRNLVLSAAVLPPRWDAAVLPTHWTAAVLPARYSARVEQQ